MWLYVGYGTLIGAMAGVALLSIWMLSVAVRLYRVHHPRPNQSEESKANEIYFVFELSGAVDFFKETPVQATLQLIIIPILICATAGFVIENILRLF